MHPHKAKTFLINPIALGKAKKLYAILAFLSAIGLKMATATSAARKDFMRLY